VSRILSQHDNVIAADFRPRTSLDITVTFKTETLYADGTVMLLRTTASIGDKPFLVTHILGDLATGAIVQLNHG
jgi:hypothetical protein